MPELDINEVFERFKSGGPLMIPAGPDAARRVSERRRTIRLSTAVATAVVLVTVGASVVAYDLVPRGNTPDVGSSLTPTAPPPTDIPTTTATPDPPSPTATGQPDGPPVLQPSDAPAGFRYEGDTIRGDWTLEFAASLCAPPNPLAGVPSATTQWEALFRTGSDPDEYIAIHQRVADYAAADAAGAYVAAVRRLAQECVPTIDDQATPTITHQGFAGDDSLVLSYDRASSFSTYIVVRVDDLVTQIWYPDTVAVDPVQLGQRAAARMCAATTAC